VEPPLARPQKNVSTHVLLVSNDAFRDTHKSLIEGRSAEFDESLRGFPNHSTRVCRQRVACALSPPALSEKCYPKKVGGPSLSAHQLCSWEAGGVGGRCNSSLVWEKRHMGGSKPEPCKQRDRGGSRKVDIRLHGKGNSNPKARGRST